ncbi:MAG: alpha/beta hydrolase [Leptospiraceae bacterium]|nr:alpha/beta hydrolase [Leptospiraceae bacterium]MCZ8345783.1 alpha/beta hydrolase [Leptospiraceae bacterium]
MQEKSFRFHDLNLKYYDYSEAKIASKPLVLFAHANGYSAGCYRQYHQALSQKYRVLALDFAGHGKSQSTLAFKTWFFFRDQILALLQSELKPGQKVIGIGHSLGGASMLLASQKSPELFAKVLAMDPVVLGWRITTLAKFLEGPLAQGARKRRRQFASLELVQRAFSKFPAFANWEPEFFQDYLNSCLRPTGNGKEVELCCDPKVEARIFSLASFRVMRKYHSIKSEVHVSIPEKYEVCSPSLARLITKKNPNSSITVWKDASHFFPFENKDRTLNWIESKLT